ncbi:tyrosine-type recombinase/integrase [Halodesulfovibrio aestuarii]|uniref:Tyrosine-type recombinase/integrase n=1 Tax=Halodesulfovibrio aestuarii TaxID=126333 RepID=A0ABV4JPV2_9BACT
MARGKRIKTRYSGVYQRQTETRRHEGRLDVGYDITYKVGRRKVWENVGWKSEGVTAGFANQIRNERLAAARDGKVPSKTKHMTLNEAFELYCKTHLAATKSERRIRSMYSSGVQPVLGHKMIAEISVRDMQQLATKLVGKRAPATIRHYVSIVRSVYNKLIEWGDYAGDNPAQTVKIPRVDNDRTRFLSRSEAAMLLDELCCRSLDTFRITLLSLHTGMRASEIFGLMGEDINMNDGFIYIKDTKNALSRVAYMTDDIRKVFEDIAPQAGEIVFPARHGSFRDEVPDTFERAVKELGLNDGLSDTRDRVVFHTLRHTFASWLVSEGVPLKTVQELLGHSTIRMTERYAKLAPDKKEEAARLLNMLTK